MEEASNENRRELFGWGTIAGISIGLFLLTFSPILAGFLPYIRMGWPAVRTAFWLKQVDPWRARGTVGFLFHFSMAGFRAGACGFFCLVFFGLVGGIFNRGLDMVQGMTAVAVIMLAFLTSFVFGWIGTVIAFRHRVRVFVVSHLKELCHGDFSRAASVTCRGHQVNPAKFIIIAAIATPLCVIWCIALFASMPPIVKPDAKDIVPIAAWIVFGCIPLIGVACLQLLSFLSTRIMATSPAECWGAPIPESAGAIRSIPRFVGSFQ